MLRVDANHMCWGVGGNLISVSQTQYVEFGYVHQLRFEEQKFVETREQETYGLQVPSRFKIYKLLESGKKLYAAKIAEELKLDRKLVSFHLAWLERHGYVKSTFGLANPPKVSPKAVRYYESTGKDRNLVNALRETLGQR